MQKKTPASYEEFLQQFKVDAPQGFNFAFDVLDTIADQDPDRLALVHVDNNLARTEYTFDSLKKSSARLANALKAQGVGKSDRIMIILYRRPEFWTAMMALHRIGAVVVPSPNLLTEKDIVYRVNRGKIKGAIVEDSVSQTVAKAASQCDGFNTLIQIGPSPLPQGWLDYNAITAQAPDQFPEPADRAGGDDPLLVFFSSGTTGQPKMVEHTHFYPLGHLCTGIYWHDLAPGGLHLTLADTGWGKAVWGKLYGQWMAGATVFAYDFRGKFEPEKLLQVMAENKVTSFCAPPTVYRFLIRLDLSAYDLSALKHCTTAGELLNASVFKEWKKATGLPIYEGYGQTETTLQIATFPFMTPKPGSIGRPVPGWDVVLLDLEGQPCPPGEEGEICIRMKDQNIGLFTHYVDEDEKTKSVMINGFYHTGDKAWMDEDGYIWFLGRVDDLIKSSGYRIGPFEVESALITHPAVVESAVTGLPDPIRGQIVKATVVLAPGFTPSDDLTKELQNHVKTVTAPYKYPRIIEYAAELPKTISGKIKRAEIRERDNAN